MRCTFAAAEPDRMPLLSFITQLAAVGPATAAQGRPPACSLGSVPPSLAGRSTAALALAAPRQGRCCTSYRKALACRCGFAWQVADLSVQHCSLHPSLITAGLAAACIRQGCGAVAGGGEVTRSEACARAACLLGQLGTCKCASGCSSHTLPHVVPGRLACACMSATTSGCRPAGLPGSWLC